MYIAALPLLWVDSFGRKNGGGGGGERERERERGYTLLWGKMGLKFDKFQLAKLLFLLFSLTLIPFVPACLWTPYIYILLNSLILALGYESGVLKFLTEPTMEKKKPSAIAVLDLEGDNSAIPHISKPSEESSCEEEKSPKRSPSTPKVKKNPSLPSLFLHWHLWRWNRNDRRRGWGKRRDFRAGAVRQNWEAHRGLPPAARDPEGGIF